MGYKRNPKIYHLVFGDDTDYPGLEANVRTLSMGQLFKIWTVEGAGSSASTFELFVERLVSWNLEDENGKPVPVTRKAIENEDDDLVNALIVEWLAQVRGVSAPLDGDLNSGGTSPAGLSLAEASSPSPKS